MHLPDFVTSGMKPRFLCVFSFLHLHGKIYYVTPNSQFSQCAVTKGLQNIHPNFFRKLSTKIYMLPYRLNQYTSHLVGSCL